MAQAPRKQNRPGRVGGAARLLPGWEAVAVRGPSAARWALSPQRQWLSRLHRLSSTWAPGPGGGLPLAAAEVGAAAWGPPLRGERSWAERVWLGLPRDSSSGSSPCSFWTLVLLSPGAVCRCGYDGHCEGNRRGCVPISPSLHAPVPLLGPRREPFW